MTVADTTMNVSELLDKAAATDDVDHVGHLETEPLRSRRQRPCAEVMAEIVPRPPAIYCRPSALGFRTGRSFWWSREGDSNP